MSTSTVTPRTMPGIGQVIDEVFKTPKRDKPVREGGDKQTTQELFPGYPEYLPIEGRIKFLGWRFYREGSFEKVQFARKWMRNALMVQGYHELEWSEINVAWEAIIRDSGDYAFPNNYYRSHIMYGAGMYVKNAPKFDFNPAYDSYDSQAAAQAAKAAFEIIKENVNYDYIRVLEAIYLRLFGNSFRYSYYSLDPRYGHVTTPVYEPAQAQIDQGFWGPCPNCKNFGEGNPKVCPVCGQALPPQAIHPPHIVDYQKQAGNSTYPRGQEITEVVSPMEMGARSSAPSLWYSPYLYRARIVDRVSLQSDYPDVDLGVASGLGYVDDGGGNAYNSAQDLSLIYQQSLADLPGDPTQYAAWYERATSYGRVMLLQAWIRPNQYAFDKEMKERFPDGIYAEIVGDKLLFSRNESMDDHWVLFRYNPVPGRLWADGDDDLIPKQLQLNETERLILRNQAFSSVPQLVVDTQRIDKDKIVNDPQEIIGCKITGRPVRDAIEQLQGQSLPQETWQWRAAQLEDMQHHSGVFNAAIGVHEPGVNTFGGQEFMASRAEQNLSPLLLMYKEANELWAKQVLKIAAENWLDDRVRSLMGINGNWEFSKLRGKMLSLDKIQITATLIPVDYTQQQSMTQAVASGLLNPQDPRVQKKALELYQLPTELSQFSSDAKPQWKEIEKMKQGQQVKPVFLRDNDDVHIDVCRVWLNSDDAEESPQAVSIVYQHMLQHMMNKLHMSQMMAAMNIAPQEVAARANAQYNGGMQPAQGARPQQGQPQQAGQGQRPQQGQRPSQPQAGRRGGQVPTSPPQRQQRAQKGRAAKPNRPQPPGGNQYQRGQTAARMTRPVAR